MIDIFWRYLNSIQESKSNNNSNQKRFEIKPGQTVYIVEKHNQKTGILTKGVVKTILTSKKIHTRGIKVRLMSGQVGRVQCIVGVQDCNKLRKHIHDS